MNAATPASRAAGKVTDALVPRGQTFARERRVLVLMAGGVVGAAHPIHYLNK